MFPIYNTTGKVVGFTGRIFGEAPPEAGKYVNSPETPIFNKSKILYGFHKTKSEIRNSQSAILVEGQMDFLMTYQAGIKNVAASSGTALTGDHLGILRRLSEKIILCFDMDEAGQKAVERSIDLALAQDFSVGVVILPGKDPADLVKEQPALLPQLVATAKSVKEFYFNRYLTGDNLKQKVRLVLAKVKNLFSPVEQALWLKELSQRTGIEERHLAAELEKLNIRRSDLQNIDVNLGRSDLQKIEDVSRKQLIIQRILQLGGSLPDFISPEEKQASDLVVLRAAWENAQAIDGDQTKEMDELRRQLKIENYREQLAGLKITIAQAERENNDSQLVNCLTAIDRISRQLHNIITHGQETQDQEI